MEHKFQRVAEARRIVAATCKAFSIDEKVLRERCRKPELVVIRFAAWRIVRQRAKMPTSEMSVLFNRDNSSIKYGIGLAGARRPSLETDRLVEAAVERIEKELSDDGS